MLILPALFHFSAVFGGTFAMTIFAYWALGTALLMAHNDYPELRIQSNVELSDSALSDLITTILFNQFIVQNCVALFLYPFQRNMDIFGALCFWHLPVFALLHDVLFYTAHRLLHHPWFYWIHKQHHTFTAPFSLVAIYAHPLEHVVANLLPVMIGPILLHANFITTLTWQLIATFTTLLVHSGLKILPAQIHDYHHSQGKYNYGSLGLMDWLFGTKK